MRNQLLRDTDWVSMSHSLEIRVPLVEDHVLSEALLGLAASGRLGAGKSMLPRTLARGLPDEILNRPRAGFVVPTWRWLRHHRGLRYLAVRARAESTRAHVRRSALGLYVAEPPPGRQSPDLQLSPVSPTLLFIVRTMETQPAPIPTRISVVMPCYNAAPFVREAVECVMGQTRATSN